MSSKIAKELKALALSLQLVNDDLQQKAFFRKSQYYKESEMYKREKQRKILAAQNLAKDKQVTPIISGVLQNALVNAAPEVYGADEEKDEVIRTPILSSSISEGLSKLRPVTRSVSEPVGKDRKTVSQQLKELREQLKKTPVEEKPPPEERRPKTPGEIERGERKEELLEASKKRRERRVTKTDLKIAQIMGELTAYASGKTRKQFFPTSLVEIMSTNQLYRTIKELKQRRSAIAKNVDNDVAIMDKYDRKVMQLENRLGMKTGNVGDPSELGGSAAAVAGPKIITTDDGSATEFSEMEGEGLNWAIRKYYPRELTPDMNRLIMLIGSRRAGNDSPEVFSEIKYLVDKIRKEVFAKIKKDKELLKKQKKAKPKKQKVVLAKIDEEPPAPIKPKLKSSKAKPKAKPKSKKQLKTEEEFYKVQALMINNKNRELIRKGSNLRIKNPYEEYLPVNKLLPPSTKPKVKPNAKLSEEYYKTQALMINNMNRDLIRKGSKLRIENPYEEYLPVNKIIR